MEEMRRREEQRQEFYRQQREAADTRAIQEGKMPPTQIKELKDKLNSDPNLRVMICAQLAANVVLARPELASSRSVVEEVAVLAGQAAVFRAHEMDKTLAVYGDFWDMSASPFEVLSAIEKTEQGPAAVNEDGNG